MLSSVYYFEISGCLKFIVSYFAPGVRRKCLQGDNCERPTNLCFPDSTPILATKLKLHIWQNDIVKKWNDKEWFWKTICFCYCNKINQINYISSRWWITLWERNDIFKKRPKILFDGQPPKGLYFFWIQFQIVGD